MKSALIITMLCSLLVGCGGSMSNAGIIEATKQCKDAGLSPEYLRDLNGNIGKVQCGPPKGATR